MLHYEKKQRPDQWKEPFSGCKPGGPEPSMLQSAVCCLAKKIPNRKPLTKVHVDDSCMEDRKGAPRHCDEDYVYSEETIEERDK